MPKHKLTPKIEQQIKDLAKRLPEDEYLSVGTTTISGSEMLLSNRKEDSNGNPVDPKQTYSLEIPVKNRINHERRMRRAFKSGGEKAILDYLKPYFAGIKED